MSEDNENPKNVELEIREQYRRSIPAMRKAYGSEDDFVSWMLAKQQADDALALIAPEGEVTPRQAYFAYAPMPTDLCRVSPFFPMSKNDMAKRDYIEDMPITTSSWGGITYTGPRLSTYEEDVLLAVLALLNNRAENKYVTVLDGVPTYTYIGSLRPILKMMGYDKTGANDYKRILLALKRMQATSIEMQIRKNTTRKKSVLKKTIMNNMIPNAVWDHETKELSVTINPYFYELYLKGTCTLINMQTRSKLKSPVAKSLMRFVESHAGDHWQGHIYTLADSLNMDRDQPTKEIRRTLNNSIASLIKNGVLMEGSQVNGDLVTLVRKPRSRATLRALPKKSKKS